MPITSRSFSATLLAALLYGGPGFAQDYVGPIQPAAGTPVDRNVADTGANAASQRIAQPGLGKFGVGSLLLDRYATRPSDIARANPYVGDPRVSQRYLLQAPGFTALTQRPDYVGPSPQGGWVRNAQTFDGTEIMTLTAANTVFVLSPELLQPQQVHDFNERTANQVIRQDLADRLRVQPQPAGQAVSARVGSTKPETKNFSHGVMGSPALELERNPNYVHPEIIERRRKLKAERETEREREAKAKSQEPAKSEAGHKEVHEEQKEQDK